MLRMSRKNRYRAERRAASATYLHWQGNDVSARRRQTFESGQVLEGRNIALVERAMRLERRGGPVIDAGGIDPDGVNLPVCHDPARRIRVQAGKMQISGAFVAPEPRAQVSFRTRPAGRKPRPEQDNRIRRDR